MTTQQEKENKLYYKFVTLSISSIVGLYVLFYFFSIPQFQFILGIIIGIYLILLGFIGGFYLKRYPRISIYRPYEIKRPFSTIVGIFLIITGFSTIIAVAVSATKL